MTIAHGSSMDTTAQVKNGISKAKKTTDAAFDAASDHVEEVDVALEQRIEQARDLLEDLRDRAEIAMQERPYLLPVAAGAVGLGVGVLIGSRLSRMLVVGAAGALLSDSIRSQVVKMSKEFISDLGDKLEVDGEEDVEEPAAV